MIVVEGVQLTGEWRPTQTRMRTEDPQGPQAIFVVEILATIQSLVSLYSNSNIGSSRVFIWVTEEFVLYCIFTCLGC